MKCCNGITNSYTMVRFLKEENTKLKETIKQAKDLLHKCNSSDANVDRAIELLTKQ